MNSNSKSFLCCSAASQPFHCSGSLVWTRRQTFMDVIFWTVIYTFIPVNHITHTESDTHSLTPGVSGLVDPSPLQRRPSRHPSPLPAAASPLHQWSAWDLTSSKQWNLSFRFVQLFSSKVVLVLTSITAVHRSEHAFSPHRDRITNDFVFN